MNDSEKLKEIKEFARKRSESLQEILEEMAEQQGVEIEEINYDELDCPEYQDDYISALALIDQLYDLTLILNK